MQSASLRERTLSSQPSVAQLLEIAFKRDYFISFALVAIVKLIVSLNWFNNVGLTKVMKIREAI